MVAQYVVEHVLANLSTRSFSKKSRSSFFSSFTKSEWVWWFMLNRTHCGKHSRSLLRAIEKRIQDTLLLFIVFEYKTLCRILLLFIVFEFFWMNNVGRVDEYLYCSLYNHNLLINFFFFKFLPLFNWKKISPIDSLDLNKLH